MIPTVCNQSKIRNRKMHNFTVIGFLFNLLEKNFSNYILFICYILTDNVLQKYFNIKRKFWIRTLRSNAQWICIWRFRLKFSVKDFWQTVQWNGFSPEWAFTCRLWSLFTVNNLPHTGHSCAISLLRIGFITNWAWKWFLLGVRSDMNS